MRAIQLLFAVLLIFSAGFVFAGGEKSANDKEIARLAKLEKAYVDAKKAFAAKPKDAKARTNFLKNAKAFAKATLFSPALAPKQKYPKALRVYREVLKTDPKDKEAKESVQTIEGIYKSMGRPIPK